jgi:hypothetical protein
MLETVTIGGATCALDYARSYAEKYLTDHLNEDDPEARVWSYPAYDSYRGSSNGQVGDADLLAIALLNAGRNPVKSYYGLQHLLPEINKRLAHPALEGTLIEAGPDTIEAIVDLYNVANEGRASYGRALHVRLTVLSKVLHRKKPELLPLIDRFIRCCYIWRGDPAPLVRFESDPESRDFIRAWVKAAQHDLQAAEEQWQQLADLAPDPRISPLRAMDIIGWKLGQLTRDQLKDLIRTS